MQMIVRPRFLLVYFAVFSCISGDFSVRAQEYKPASSSSVSKKRVPGPPFKLTDVKDKLELGKVENDSLGEDTGGNRVYILSIVRNDGVKPGEAIQIDASSSEFDTFLKLYQDGNSAPLLSDDNSAGGRNARLIVPPGLWGKSVIVEISSKYADEAGRFTLIAAATTYTPPEVPPDLLLDGKTIVLELTEASTRRIGSDVPVAKFEVEGKRGQRFQIDVKSSDFDPDIEIDLSDAAPSKDSDSGEGTDARFVRTFRRDGKHILTVLSADRRLGKYSVSGRILPASIDAALAPRIPIDVGQSQQSSLSAEGSATEDRAFEFFELAGIAGQSLEISVSGADPAKRGKAPALYIDAGVLTGAGFASIVPWSNRGQASKVRLTFAKSETILLRASGAPDFIGPYIISVKLLPLAIGESEGDSE